MFNFWRINKDVKYLKNKKIEGALNSENILNILGDSEDIVVKEFCVSNSKVKLKMICIDGLVNTEMIDVNILKPIMEKRVFVEAKTEQKVYSLIESGEINHLSEKCRTELDDVITDIVNGFTVLVFDEIEKAVSFEAKDVPKRAVTEPSNESVLKGAKDSFIENIRTNTALVRKKIKLPSLRFKKIIVGSITKTPISIVYIDEIVDKDILNEVITRIEKIKIDNLISTSKLEEQIVDKKFSLFPQFLYTEKVDKFCANIIDGKIGILIDGLPISYIVPAVFPMFLQAPEEYSQNYIFSSFIRFVRYICLLLTLLLPGFYVAVTSFHQEMLPTDLAMSIIQSKEGVPFQTVMEVFFMLIAFEILLEASLRLPSAVGPAISIIGGLVVGDAAVSAKFVSPAVVVVIAIAGISGFAIPNQSFSNSIRICRIIILLSASAIGLFGISFAFIYIIYELCSIETFGVPYMVPFSANEGKAMLKDTIFRLPFMCEKTSAGKG